MDRTRGRLLCASSTNDDDDVQEILVGDGQPDQLCVRTGNNGICNTTKSGDDVQMLPLNQGSPDEIAITDGINNVLDTSPSGDDQILGTSIITGADGICDTTASSLSHLNCWVKSFQFYASVCSAELPIHRGIRFITLSLPSCNFSYHPFLTYNIFR